MDTNAPARRIQPLYALGLIVTTQVETRCQALHSEGGRCSNALGVCVYVSAPLVCQLSNIHEAKRASLITFSRTQAEALVGRRSANTHPLSLGRNLCHEKIPPSRARLF
jgi:hypothetical protein